MSEAWTREEIARYARHFVLPGVGEAGQRKLKASKVLVIGAGGLGSPVLLYLAAAGVGKIGLVEHDRVDPSNLNRQVLFTEADVGKPKAEVARDRLLALNPHIEVVAYAERFRPDLAERIVPEYDLVVDASDNFPTRYLANDAAVLFKKPLVQGAIYRFEGQLSVFHYRGGPCYRCLFRKPPPRQPACSEAGVFGVLPGTVGALMATEAIKVLLGLGEVLAGTLLFYDALEAEFKKLKFPRDPACPVCGEHPTITDLRQLDYEDVCQPSPGVES